MQPSTYKKWGVCTRQVADRHRRLNRPGAPARTAWTTGLRRVERIRCPSYQGGRRRQRLPSSAVRGPGATGHPRQQPHKTQHGLTTPTDDQVRRRHKGPQSYFRPPPSRLNHRQSEDFSSCLSPKRKEFTVPQPFHWARQPCSYLPQNCRTQKGRILLLDIAAEGRGRQKGLRACAAIPIQECFHCRTRGSWAAQFRDRSLVLRQQRTHGRSPPTMRSSVAFTSGTRL